MTMREVDRLKTIQAVVDRMLRVAQAAQRLGMSRRQIERLVSRYLDDGPSGLVSRKCGRPCNNQLAAGIAERAVELIRERYADFGPTLAAEKLKECHGVVFSKETVRALMVATGLWTPRSSAPPRSTSRATAGPAWVN